MSINALPMKQVIPGRDPDTCAEQLAETLYYSNIFACPKVPNLLPSSGAAVASVASSGPGKKAADASSGSHKKKFRCSRKRCVARGLQVPAEKVRGLQVPSFWTLDSTCSP